MLLADLFFPCSAVLSQRLGGVPQVALHSAAPLLPFQNTWWAGSGRRAWLPAPLAYVPQMGAGYLHPMVSPPKSVECNIWLVCRRSLVPFTGPSCEPHADSSELI